MILFSDVCTNNLITEELMVSAGSVECIDITKLAPNGSEVVLTVKIPATRVKGTSVLVILTLARSDHTTCRSLKGLLYTDTLGCPGNNALISYSVTNLTRPTSSCEFKCKCEAENCYLKFVPRMLRNESVVFCEITTQWQWQESNVVNSAMGISFIRKINMHDKFVLFSLFFD